VDPLQEILPHHLAVSGIKTFKPFQALRRLCRPVHRHRGASRFGRDRFPDDTFIYHTKKARPP
jgi:hypothetical protein